MEKTVEMHVFRVDVTPIRWFPPFVVAVSTVCEEF